MVSPIRSPLSLLSLPRTLNWPTSPLLQERTLNLPWLSGSFHFSTKPAEHTSPFHPSTSTSQPLKICFLNTTSSSPSSPVASHLRSSDVSWAESRALTCDRHKCPPPPVLPTPHPAFPGPTEDVSAPRLASQQHPVIIQDFPENLRGVKEESSHHPSSSLLFHRHRQFFLLSLPYRLLFSPTESSQACGRQSINTCWNKVTISVMLGVWIKDPVGHTSNYEH